MRVSKTCSRYAVIDIRERHADARVKHIVEWRTDALKWVDAKIKESTDFSEWERYRVVRVTVRVPFVRAEL